MTPLDELVERESNFHWPRSGTRADLEAMIAADFREVGASGRTSSREPALDVLEERLRHPPEDDWQTSDFACLELGPDLALLNYTLTRGEQVTRRATIWRNTNGHWHALYHQGTLVQEPPASLALRYSGR